MAITFTPTDVSKPAGSKTPAATLPFAELLKFIGYWHTEIGPKLAHARASINFWRSGGHIQTHLSAVLFDIVVTFGEGRRFVWPQVNTYLTASPGNSVVANTTLANIDATIMSRAPATINGHLTSLRAITGLGSLSYGTKVLRCLSDSHVVLDKRLQDELGEVIYTDFRDKCSAIALHLGHGINPADVEAGLFVWVQCLLLARGGGHPRWRKYCSASRRGSGNGTARENRDADGGGKPPKPVQPEACDTEARDTEACDECKVWTQITKNPVYGAPILLPTMGMQATPLNFQYDPTTRQIHVWRADARPDFFVDYANFILICRRYHDLIAAGAIPAPPPLPAPPIAGGTSLFTNPAWPHPPFGQNNTPYVPPIIRDVYQRVPGLIPRQGCC